MATYPVPGEEYRDFPLEYTDLGDGNIYWHWPETGDLQQLTAAEREQFEALYPSGRHTVEDTDDVESTASSDFVLDPEASAAPERDGDHEAVDPYVRPSCPEPPHEDEEEQQQGCVTYPKPIDEFPSSPYRRRMTPDSWTGLEYLEWGMASFIDEHGLMAVRHEREAQTGVCAGLLQRCTWVGWARREEAPPSLGPELKLTTDEGVEYWLDDYDAEYAYEFEYSEGAYGHVCHEGCFASYSEDEVEMYEDREDAEDDLEPEFLASLGSGLLDQLEAAVDAERAARVQREPESASQQGKAVEGVGEAQLPRWIRDPTYVSNRSWADLDEDEEY